VLLRAAMRMAVVGCGWNACSRGVDRRSQARQWYASHSTAALHTCCLWCRTSVMLGLYQFAQFVSPCVCVSAAGMNAPVDESAEERKGGAGEIAKMLLSAGDSQVRLGNSSRAGCWQSPGEAAADACCFGARVVPVVA
jgi:hypothetical protein